MVDMGISSIIIMSPSPKYYMLLDFITDFDIFTKFREVSMEHLQRMWLGHRGRWILRISGPVLFGVCIVDTIPSWTFYVSGLF